MKNTPNFDGISKPKQQVQKADFVQRRIVLVDSIIRKTASSAAVEALESSLSYEFKRPFFDAQKYLRLQRALKRKFLRFTHTSWRASADRWARLHMLAKVPIMTAVAAVVVAFGSGMWTVQLTAKTQANDSETVAQPASYSPIPLPSNSSLGPASSVPNEVLYNMTVSQLENYFKDQNQAKVQKQQQQQLAERAAKLKNYLTEKKSPLADIASTIAGLAHWNIVLAISNSESSLGKHCYNNNCSGIGVAPDNALWRNYGSEREWAIDLDKLIEKRYKNWSLEQMNGVYVNPGSQNWVLASTQILEELRTKGIE